MKDPRMEKLAKLLVNYSCRVQKGEKVLIEVFDAPVEMTDCIIKEVYAAGGYPFLQINSNRLRRTLVKGMTKELAEKMKEIIGIWSKRREPSWSRMYRVLIEDYDPFVNIRRTEHREITQDRDLKGSYKGKVNGWNSTAAVDRDSSDTTDSGTIKTTEDYTLEGDSAITDAQDVMKKEIEVRKTYNMYDIIIEEFKRRFCLMVY